jgi:hypothetical protein
LTLCVISQSIEQLNWVKEYDRRQYIPLSKLGNLYSFLSVVALGTSISDSSDYSPIVLLRIRSWHGGSASTIVEPEGVQIDQ